MDEQEWLPDHVSGPNVYLRLENSMCGCGVGLSKGWLPGLVRNPKVSCSSLAVGHPRETVVFKGTERNLGDTLGWTAGEVYRRAEFELPAVCHQRMKMIDDVSIYGHHFSAGNPIDNEEAEFCADAPLVKSDIERHGRSQKLTPSREQVKHMREGRRL